MSLWAMLRRELEACMDFLLPPACHFCGSLPGHSGLAGNLCQSCREAIPPLAGSCRCCAKPFASTAPTCHLCESCLRTPPPFSEVFAAGRHSGPLQETIHRFKYRNQLFLADTFASLLVGRILQDNFQPDLLIPVPLHAKRLRQRGYNQALELGRALASQLDVPCTPELLRRQRHTPPQQGLSRTERQRNLENAFHCTTNLAGKRILLVDDVMTSGTTVTECSHVLAEAGAKVICVAVIGRA